MCRPNTRMSLRCRLALALLLSTGLITIPAFTPGRAARLSNDTAINQTRLAEATRLSPDAPTTDATASLTEAYGKVGMSFEENRGQTDEQVEFLSRGGGYTLFLTQTEAVFRLRNSDCGLRNGKAQSSATRFNALHSGNPHSAISNPKSEVCTQQSRVLRMKLEGANSQPAVSGLNELEGKVNYFIGNDAAKWHTNIPTFGRVHYAGVYEGIDMVYYGNQRQLEYDFIVKPGADHRQIALSFDGADRVEVEPASGDLLLRVGEQTLRQQKPVVYQEVDGERRPVESSYAIGGDGHVRFAVGAHDSTKPLVIDPVLAYSTFLNAINIAIAVDASGNTYITGVAGTTDFPTQDPIQPGYGGGGGDAFVTKLNASGSALIYSTYLGGSNFDVGAAIAVDSAGRAYIVGDTRSSNFPTANPVDGSLGGTNDAFVTKINAAGSALVFSTYLGGSNNEMAGTDEEGLGIAVDAAGNAYVIGKTNALNFPTQNPFQSANGGGNFDAYLTKLNATGSAFVYSTYLGGTGEDVGRGVSVDSLGNAYVAGNTASTNFPTSNPFQATNGGSGDAFVTKINASGSAMVYSTYLGGDSSDVGGSIAVDSAANAYITGFTSSTNFPTANAFQAMIDGQSDAFVTKINAAGSALVYSTYLGGSSQDTGSDIAVDSAGSAYITGDTNSTNFPTANPIQSSLESMFDVFVTKLNSSGTALAYSTYLGGNNNEGADDIAVDPAGNAYLTGQTFSTNFPATPNAFQPGGGSGGGYISKIGDYLIAGRVRDTGGNNISGVTVSLSGSNSASATTVAQGNFLFLDTTPSGSFVVTPFKEGYTFNPASFSVGNLNTNVPDILFTGTVTGATPTPTPTPAPTPATLQFSAASFAVDEGASKFQITVTRSGDTSPAQTVDYATTDGTANDRGDYTTSIGRLRFAPGETARSFDVLITEDAYAEGNETVQLTLSNPSPGAQLGSMTTTLLTIVDNELVTGAGNPIDSTTFFVRQHYADFFNREPDAAGLAFWLNNIDSCGADASCRETKRIDTSAAFFLSIEFQETGFLVHRLYRASFNRFPHYREFLRDSQELGRGVVVGQGPWQAQLETNKQAFVAEFVNSAEFLAVYAGLTNEQFIDALNVNTGNSLSIAERDALVTGLNNMTETRASALRKVAEDGDFAARELRPAFVLAQYFGYLRRNPDDPPDSNFDGFNFWLAKLNQFNGDFRKADMVKAFITSIEYRARVGNP